MRSTTKFVLSLLVGAGLCGAGCSDDDGPAPIAPSPQDEAPPIPPSDVRALPSDKVGFHLGWAPNSEPDLAGYRVYLYEPNEVGLEEYRLLNSNTLLPRTVYSWRGEPGMDVIQLCVAAVDDAGNESARSQPVDVHFSAGALPVEEDGDDGTGRNGGGRHTSPDPGSDDGKEPNDIDPNS